MSPPEITNMNAMKQLNLRALATLLLAASALGWTGAAGAESMDARLLKKVRAATFEVVIPKPSDDGITYEKPLPYDLLPYQYRNDKYFSVGTAFEISGHRFVTASHVINGHLGGRSGEPALRDSEGHVYAIDKILQYNSRRDFVVFSLKDEPDVTPLQTGRRPALDETIYAVGNALGEGVVIRNGVHTSDTPEDRDGAWQWLRFSAAASPGNSGGPLLDKNGRVVGIVLRKSPNENLNYALPIEELLAAKPDLAIFDERNTYALDIFDRRQTDVLYKEVSLPKTFAEFSRIAGSLHDQFADHMLQELLAGDADNLFPHGDGSLRAMNVLMPSELPALLIRGNDGNWDLTGPSQVNTSQLPDDGYLKFGRLGNGGGVELGRPKNIPADPFYHDSRLFMDLVLKGAPQKRPVGSEQVRIRSLGKAIRDEIYVDDYQRKWQLRVWPMDFADTVVTYLSLPVPSGYVALVRLSRSNELHEDIADLKALANFFSVSYHGTLAQWQDFLRQTDLLPGTLASLRVDATYGQKIEVSTGRFGLTIPSTIQTVSKDSELTLDFRYLQDHDKVVWEPTRIRSASDAQNSDLISVSRNDVPAQQQEDFYKNEWARIAGRQHPYDTVVAYNEDQTDIWNVVGPGASALPSVLYCVRVHKNGQVSQGTMKADLDAVLKSVRISDAPDPRAGNQAR